VKRTPKNGEPFIDYSKSIMMTEGEYMHSLEQIADLKEQVAQEKKRRRLDMELNRMKRDDEKQQKQQAKL